jgi:hypothetical protein
MKNKLSSLLSSNKNSLILGAITSFAALLSGTTTVYFFHGDRFSLLWACVFGLFLAFHRFGSSSHQQVFYVVLSGVLGLCAIMLTSLISLLQPPFSFIALSILLFLSLCLHRYLKGTRVWSIFLVVYILLFHSSFPFLLYPQIAALLFKISMSLMIALIFTCLLIYILPTVNVPIMPSDKNPYLIKRAIRTTILLNVAFLLGYFISVRNVAWVAFSILSICEENLKASLKKSLERGLGTLIGATIGILSAHTLFAINPYLTAAICFILIFLTYATIAYSYTIGIGLATIWVSASFYLYHLSITFNQFAVARIIDTFLGISIGLVGEFLIFPDRRVKQPHD